MRPRVVTWAALVALGAVTAISIALARSEPPAATRGSAPVPKHEAPFDDVRIRGRVLDAFGTPLAGCTLFHEPLAEPRLPSRNDPSSLAPPPSRSDPYGRFLIRIKPSESPAVLTIAHADFPVRHVPIHGPTRAGQVVDFGDLRLRSGVGLAIRVESAESGHMVEAARVTIRPAIIDARLPTAAAQALQRSTHTDDRGLAVVSGLASGGYLVRIEAEGHAVAERAVEHPSELVAVRLDAGHVLRGQVLDATGTPVDQARVTAHPLGNGTSVAALSLADGAFRITRLAAGEYCVTVDSQRLGSFERSRIEIPAAAPLTIQLPATHSITGRIRLADRPIAGIGLRLAPADGASIQAHRTRTGESGKFEFRGVPAGRYWLTGSSDRPRSTLRLAVSVPTQPVDAELLSPSIATGRVIDQRGEPISNATITLMHADANSPDLAWLAPRAGARDATQTGVDGRFDLTIDREWPFRLLTEAPGRPATLSEVHRLAAATARATVDLGEIRIVGFAIRGTLRHSDGSPAANAPLGLFRHSDRDHALHTTWTDDLGRFELKPVETGRFWLSGGTADEINSAPPASSSIELPADAANHHVLVIR